MNQNRSVATIDAPEFINLEPDAINPGISKCEIKVLYLGKNRNGSYINRETALQMANSLPGSPIVGAYREPVEDFGDHGEVIHYEDGDVNIFCKTKPYGFVAPDALVWFQRFEDEDTFGNRIQRDYLMTTGYLWTGSYPEAMDVISSGKGQSMELDSENMQGRWEEDSSTGLSFFIIDEAYITKLCILGDDVEPCFEGASVTAPNISTNFSFNEDFANTLYNMKSELNDALQNKGGSDMPEIEEVEVAEEVAPTVEGETGAENVIAENGEEFAKKDEKKPSGKCAEEDPKKKKEEEPEEGANAPKQEDKGGENAPAKEADDEEKKKTQHALEEAQNRIAVLETELSELREFKLQKENEAKDALFAKYFMLNEEDVADLKENKSNFSLEELEAKLALKYVEKNVDFSTIDGQPEVEEVETEDAITTFSLDTDVAGPVPAVVELLRQTV